MYRHLTVLDLKRHGHEILESSVSGFSPHDNAIYAELLGIYAKFTSTTNCTQHIYGCLEAYLEERTLSSFYAMCSIAQSQR